MGPLGLIVDGSTTRGNGADKVVQPWRAHYFRFLTSSPAPAQILWSLARPGEDALPVRVAAAPPRGRRPTSRGAGPKHWTRERTDQPGGLAQCLSFCRCRGTRRAERRGRQ